MRDLGLAVVVVATGWVLGAAGAAVALTWRLRAIVGAER